MRKAPDKQNDRGLPIGKTVPSVALLAMVLTGCAGSGEPRASHSLPELEVSTDVQYNDIPVPFQFSFDNKKSWQYRKFEDAAMPFRSAELIYWGDSPIRHLARWYESQMPQHGWELHSTNEANWIELVFNKGIEQTEIKLQRMVESGGRSQVTKITCRIRARS